MGGAGGGGSCEPNEPPPESATVCRCLTNSVKPLNENKPLQLNTHTHMHTCTHSGQQHYTAGEDHGNQLATETSSTSNVRTEFGGIFPSSPFLPYAHSGCMTISACSPTVIVNNASSHPRITLPSPTLNFSG